MNKPAVTKRIFCYLLFLLPFADTQAADDLLSRRLSVSFHDTPLRQALDEIARLASFEWSYNAGILEADRRVSLTARDWTLREVLQDILGEGYSFKSSGRYLILKKQKPPKSQLSGVIRDPKTGERLANVTIYDKKTLRATTTDSSGYYRLKVKKSSEIVISRLGYRDTLLQVSSQSPRYQPIELAPVVALPADSMRIPTSLQKTLKNAVSELEYFFNATFDKWHELNVPDTLHRRFQVSFLPRIGTNHVLSEKVTNDWSLNILAGQSAGVRRAEVAGLGNFTKTGVEGVQVAGLFNANRGNCAGVQVAGIFNQTADTLTGVQVGGLYNVARYSPLLFVQVAGLVNTVRKAESGATTPPKGVQISGLVNRSHELHGAQVAGLVNVANEQEGVQIAGIVNRARKIRGVQIGLINHTDELHGVQIGLINRSGKRWLPLINFGL